MACPLDMTVEIAAAAVDKRFDAYIEAAVATGLVTEAVADDFTDALAAKRKQPATLIGELDELSQKRIREGFASPAALETLWAARMTGKMDTHMCEVEIQRLSEAWQEMGFLGRHAFFVAVRMNRGHWEEGPAGGLAPDSLCLDLLEYALLKADTYAGIFADTLRGVIHPICDCEETADQEPQAEAKVKPRGPLAAMLRMQEYWYTELADRNPKLAETENMDPEDMEAVTFMFLVWFGEAFSRWLARVPSPSLALPCVLGGAYAALPHLDARVERLRAGRQLSERGYARSKADRKEVIGSTKRMCVPVPHLVALPPPWCLCMLKLRELSASCEPYPVANVVGCDRVPQIRAARACQAVDACRRRDAQQVGRPPRARRDVSAVRAPGL